MIRLFLLLLTLSVTAFSSQAGIKTHFKLDNARHTMAQVENKGKQTLHCTIAIDGYKIPFKLPPNSSSIWYRATDIRFNYTHFSTRCVLAP